MTAAAQRISEDSLHERLGLHGPKDELKELGDTIDGLLERLEAAFNAQRRFVANASHELRTPLTTMRAALDVALAKPEPAAAADGRAGRAAAHRARPGRQAAGSLPGAGPGPAPVDARPGRPARWTTSWVRGAGRSGRRRSRP